MKVRSVWDPTRRRMDGGARSGLFGLRLEGGWIEEEGQVRLGPDWKRDGWH